jgi:hypothetical protein
MFTLVLELLDDTAEVALEPCLELIVSFLVKSHVH